jgi:hypothetical protein
MHYHELFIQIVDQKTQSVNVFAAAAAAMKLCCQQRGGAGGGSNQILQFFACSDCNKLVLYLSEVQGRWVQC